MKAESWTYIEIQTRRIILFDNELDIHSPTDNSLSERHHKTLLGTVLLLLHLRDHTVDRLVRVELHAVETIHEHRYGFLSAWYVPARPRAREKRVGMTHLEPLNSSCKHPTQ